MANKFWMKQSLISANSRSQCVFLVSIFTIMATQSTYITWHLKSNEYRQNVQQVQGIANIGKEYSNSQPVPVQHQFPDVIIYRRTKKTGSSSMLEQLLIALEKYHYLPLYHGPRHLQVVVRGENTKLFPRRLFIAGHNSVTRRDTGGRRTIIIDTVLDGYKQVTSYCRFGQQVEKCDDELIKCLQSRTTLSQRYYRWGNKMEEDETNYIDLPLSAAHPALSTTLLRRVFPDVTLDIAKRNAVGSACPEVSSIRAAYNRDYGHLEKQVNMLRLRMLGLAGYPILVTHGDISTEELLDRAEEIEKDKYSFQFGNYNGTKQVSAEHRELKDNERAWVKLENGTIILQGAHD